MPSRKARQVQGRAVCAVKKPVTVSILEPLRALRSHASNRGLGGNPSPASQQGNCTSTASRWQESAQGRRPERTHRAQPALSEAGIRQHTERDMQADVATRFEVGNRLPSHAEGKREIPPDSGCFRADRRNDALVRRPPGAQCARCEVRTPTDIKVTSTTTTIRQHAHASHSQRSPRALRWRWRGPLARVSRRGSFGTAPRHTRTGRASLPAARELSHPTPPRAHPPGALP